MLDDYERAGHRIASVGLLFSRKFYADVVGESQKVVELLLRALLRF